MSDRLSRLFVGTGIPSFSFVLASLAMAASGDFDTTFGTGGHVQIELTSGSGADFASDVAIQPDGFIVVAGTADYTGSKLLAVARFAPDGTLDPTFGSGGVTTTDQPGSWEPLSSLALQPDGRILVAATVFPLDFGLVRWNSDGTLDATFGSAGAASVDLGNVGDMAVQPDGRIVIAGDHYNGSDVDLALARFEADGTLDATFGTGGIVTTDVTGAHAFALGLQPDGGLVVALQVWTGSWDLLVARYAADGSLDGTFGSGGIVITDLGAVPHAVIVQPDGKILVGLETLTLHPDAGLIRYEADGSLDPTFGSGGIVITDWNEGGADYFGDMALQPDGRIVTVGAAEFAMPDFFALAVARYEPDGSLDATFGSGGISIRPGWGGGGSGVALQADGRIVVAGLPDFTVGRLIADCGNGTVDPGEGCDDSNNVDGDCCSSACESAPDGEPCIDSDACTTGATCSAGVCGSPVVCAALCETCDSDVGCVGAPKPEGTCKSSTRPGGRLLLRDASSDSRDRLLWKWRDGEATLPAELGDPLSGQGYTVCVFDESATAPRVIASARVPGEDGSCGARPCWKGAGQPPGSAGFRYRDRSGTPDGLQSLRIEPGVDGEAKFLVKGKGDLLDPGPLPASSPVAVRAQLGSDAGACFEATFSASGVLRNDGEWLELRAD